MKVIVKASEFNSPNQLDRVSTISEFVDNLIRHSLYEAHEIDQTALRVYFIVFYIAQTSNNGLLNFLRKNYMNVSALEHIYDGLGEIGATKHQEIFKEACEILNMLEPDAFESLILTGDNNLDDKFRSKTVPVCFGINELDEHLAELEKGEEKISDFLYNFVGKMQNIYIVHNSRYEEEMEKLFAEVPDYEKRLLAAESGPDQDNGPELSSMIAEVCTKFNINLISIDRVGRNDEIADVTPLIQNKQEGVIYCYFSTEEGKFYITIDGNQVSLYEEDNKRLIGNIFLN